ncbi:phage tail protein [Aureispira anguillae]|uniref:Phage tail protein n=1 Tax=Aureispira anguillae TaxID=2864201 RepID=A0A915YIU2_9BACT|nr:phage tail protein [Aureispira anguillae]BDS14000.1 phage tail protein [Aureispira anguillae]
MSDYQASHPLNGADFWPLAKFSFRVTIDGLPELGFQTVEGLEVEVSIMEYRDGASGVLHKSKRPGLTTYSNITFKKGEFVGDANLKDWMHLYQWERATNRTERKQIIIELLDEAEDVMMTWTVAGAFPVKFTPTALDAEADSEVAVEEIEVAIESWTLDKA